VTGKVKGIKASRLWRGFFRLCVLRNVIHL
jgi:hypothetical protein